MNLPVLPAVNNSEIFISGDVIIDENAVIASGVILQAAKGSKIIISAGACIGMGSILKAYQGVIEVKENAVLGAGTLIIGASRINSQVCVGTSTTIYNTSIESGTIIPGGSVIGDPSRSVESFSNNGKNPTSVVSHIREESIEPKSTFKEKVETNRKEKIENNENSFTKAQEKINEQFTHIKESKTQNNFQTKNVSPQSDVEVTKSENISIPEDPWQTTSIEKSQSVNVNDNPVVGQMYVNNLLLTLFPEKQSKDK